MQHERFAHDDPREWLNRARSNLAQARHHVIVARDVMVVPRRPHHS